MGTEHFDAKAAGWDGDERKVAQARDVARAVAQVVPLSPTTRLLDYGAGTGLVAQSLAPHVGPVTLADNSAGMRSVLQGKLASGVFADARVWDLDLEQEEPPDARFDVVVSSMALHHVRELDRVLSGLAALLAVGGHLCVADLDREDGSFHQHDFDGHHGFDRAELAGRLRAVGLADVVVRDCTDLLRDGVSYPVFLAVAHRSD